MGNPRVFFDITIDGVNTGRIIMEVNKRTRASCFSFYLILTHEIYVISGTSEVWQKFPLYSCLNMRLKVHMRTAANIFPRVMY